MAKTNAKDELRTAERKAGASMVAAVIVFGFDYGSDVEDRPSFTLPPRWSREEFFNLEAFLDREYDSGFGSQMLHGTVWLSDGSWLERGEYDGSEWWAHRKCPAMPKA
jgi:hypothetical protein